jgi:hypothetical protein
MTGSDVDIAKSKKEYLLNEFFIFSKQYCGFGVGDLEPNWNIYFIALAHRARSSAAIFLGTCQKDFELVHETAALSEVDMVHSDCRNLKQPRRCGRTQ